VSCNFGSRYPTGAGLLSLADAGGNFCLVARQPCVCFCHFLLWSRPLWFAGMGGRHSESSACSRHTRRALAKSRRSTAFHESVADSPGQVRSAGAHWLPISCFLWRRANGLVDVPPKTTLPVGGIVPVMVGMTYWRTKTCASASCQMVQTLERRG